MTTIKVKLTNLTPAAITRTPSKVTVARANAIKTEVIKSAPETVYSYEVIYTLDDGYF